MKMEIVLAAAGMPFGPNTLKTRSLGGSESAALQVVKELSKLGHMVTCFCNLPPAGRDDYWENGASCEDGVRWVNIEQYHDFITNTDVDLLIASRNPQLLIGNIQAKKTVLWCHDLATYKNYTPALMQESWKIDQIWTVSEYHREQINKVTGYPIENIKATRNGILAFDSLLDVPKIPKTLFYAARPERGLENLVRPGGIMEMLPDYKLSVCMYDNYPEHMMEYYQQLWERCAQLPNVEVLGSLTQMQVRQRMKSSWAYAYPTTFEEVSCIIAREAMEQGLPFITTKIGALPETLGDCAKYVEGSKEEIVTEAWLKQYADTVEALHADEEAYGTLVERCLDRKDLYWADVAAQWIDWVPVVPASDYSLLTSLIKESDIIPALAFAKTIDMDAACDGVKFQVDQLNTQYPFLTGETTFEEYYEGIYHHEDEKNVKERQTMTTLQGAARYNDIAQTVARLPDGSTIIDYGCAEGPIILGLAQDFPNKKFIGIDFVADNVGLCRKYSADNNISNVEFHEGSTDNWPVGVEGDAAIVSEVLEHVTEPWKVTDIIEGHVKLGGPIIITVPQGAWEWSGLQVKGQWNWRAHIWHIDKFMLRYCWANKKDRKLNTLANSYDRSGRKLGHLSMVYTCDREPSLPLDPLEKIEGYVPRQTMAACMIAMNDDDQILHCLNTIHKDIDQLFVALGPSSDNTREYLDDWADEHPWVQVEILDVPKIMAPERLEAPFTDGFGFDDARNESIAHVDTDWVLWIDSDEYLSGDNIQMYLRDNCFDSYGIHQHHFTCQPRGEPAQLDKPARLFRSDRGYQFYGKVHEHAEVSYNGGPGIVFLVGDIDIGHTGYVNDSHRKDRFLRNFPLLKWDRVVNPDRKLGLYLWLRDLVQRIDIHVMNHDYIGARHLAEEAVEFYKTNWEHISWVAGGPTGSNNANAYYGKALKVLGRGREVGVQIQLEDNVATYNGIFETAEEAMEIAVKGLEEQFKLRESGYWE